MGSKREPIGSRFDRSTDSYSIAHGESRGILLELKTLSDSERIYSATPSDYLPNTATSFAWSHTCDRSRMPVTMRIGMKSDANLEYVKVYSGRAYRTVAFLLVGNHIKVLETKKSPIDR